MTITEEENSPKRRKLHEETADDTRKKEIVHVLENGNTELSSEYGLDRQDGELPGLLDEQEEENKDDDEDEDEDEDECEDECADGCCASSDEDGADLDEEIASDDEDYIHVMEELRERISLGDTLNAILHSILSEEEIEDMGIDSSTLQLEDLARLATFTLRMKEEMVYIRPRLFETIDSLDFVVDLIRKAKNIIVLSGAGVSVSCGIPDFRSPGGLYDTVSKRYTDMDDPQSLFDIDYFRRNPVPFFEFMKELLPSKELQPSVTHRFIAALEKNGQLLRNYSQNIDGLELKAGLTRAVPCHGSFSSAHCLRCHAHYEVSEIELDIHHGIIPICKDCKPDRNWSVSEIETDDDMDPPVIKPDIVFFGERLPEDFFTKLEEDADKADLLLVLGTSLNVAPVARVPLLLKHNIPQILLNRTIIEFPHIFDAELQGDCDDIVQVLNRSIGLDLGPLAENGTTNTSDLPVYEPPRRFKFLRSLGNQNGDALLKLETDLPSVNPDV